MLTFFKVLYLAFVAVVEITVAFILMPALGPVVTVIVEVVLFAVLMMFYAVIFGKWRPDFSFLFDFF